METADLLTGLLRAVSRSFYLTLRVLPAAVRPQIGLAYLLARTTDTIADTELVPLAERLEWLDRLRARIQGTSTETLDLRALAGRQGSTAEQILLERAEESLAMLARLSYSDQQRIREVLDTITSGQELDLKRFAGAGRKNVIALETDDDLDDYTYRVAGCVGIFWTKICRAHLFPQAKLDEIALLAYAVRFGKGLQLVNILRDLRRDLRQGRCYLPANRLAACGLKPADLLEPESTERLRPAFDAHLDLARAHLAAGWAYTNALPWRCARVRLACAWPIQIGIRTLDLLRLANPLDARHQARVSREEVYGLIARSVLLYPAPSLWKKIGPL
jgi:farnesyl-diphosphate farnesyltransferase